MLWPTSTICDRFGSHAHRVVRLAERGQVAAEQGGAGEERIARVVAEEPELVAGEDGRLRAQVVFELRPGLRIGRQAVHEHDGDFARLKRLAHVQAVVALRRVGAEEIDESGVRPSSEAA